MMPQHSLEQEAMDRVRRMYAPFDNRVPHTDAPDPPRQPRSEPQLGRQKPQATAAPDPPDKTHPESAAKAASLLDIFMQDKDQSLILLLLVLLMKDGADMNLMLALVYLLIE